MDDITIGVTENVNLISVTAQPNDQIIDIAVTETVETVLLDVSTTVQEVSVTATQNVIVENITVDYVSNENHIDINVTDATQDVTLNVTPTLIEINILRSGGEVNILQFDTLADFPSTGSSDYFYLAKDTNKLYRWTGSAYAEISATSSPVWGQIIGTLSEQTDLQNALNLKAPINSPTFTGTVSGITKAMVGLAQVDNTSDLDKPISTATQTALNNKQPLDGDLTSIAALSGTFGLLKKTANNSYTIDTNTYLTEITSSDVTDALGFTPENAANKGIANGYASLDGGGKVPSSQLPSYVDDVIEVANYGSLPSTGETGKIYITLDTNKIYRWSGSVYVEVSSSAAVWGGITGTLSAQTDLQNALNAKENTITAGTTAQYYRGDKSFQTLDTSVVPEGSNLYFTDARVNANGNVTANTAARHNAVTLGTANGLSLSTQVLSLGLSSGSTTGALSSTDWTTFNNKYPASNPNGYTSNVGTVTSVAMTVPSAFSVSGSPITSSGTLAVTATGNTTQYIAGDGSLVTFPTMSTAGTLIREVRNTTGATLTKGTVVYISGATGNKPTVSKAIATGDSTSAQTFGLVQADIANNANGNVVCAGDITGIDTSALTEGAQLYLSSTTAGAYTTTKQYAPAHLVYIGIVTRAHPSLGQIEVNIQNGYELDELHNVAAQTPSNNDGLFYESSTSLWKNKSIATVLGYTPANGADYVPLSGDQSISGIKNFTGFAQFENGVYIKQGTGLSAIAGYNLIDADTTGIYLTLPNLTSNVHLNLSNVTAQRDIYLPNSNGTLALTSDLHNAVTIGTANGLSLSTQVLSLALASTSTTGALSSTDWNTFNGKQNALTNPVTGTGTTNYLPKFTGTSAVGNSLLYDTGSILLVGATSASDSQSKLELVSANTVGLKIISSGANGNNTFLSIQSSKEWRFLTNRGDLIGGNQGDLIIRNNTDGINHIILNQGGSTTFAGSVTGRSYGIREASAPRGGLYPYNLVAGTGTDYSVGVYSESEIYLASGGSATKRLVLTSAGNVGIGTTTPTSPVANRTAMVIRGGSNGAELNLQSTSATDGTSVGFALVAASSDAYYVNRLDGAHIWLSGGGGNSERMRITSYGNVGIGTSSGFNQISGTETTLKIANSNVASTYLEVTGVRAHANYVGPNGSLVWYDITAATQRMQITSGGDFIFTGQSSSKIQFYNAYSGSPANVGLALFNTSGTTVIALNANGGGIYSASLGTGIVYSSGGSLTSTNPSDSRLKKNIKTISYGLSDIMKLRPVSYNWETDSINQGIQFGFIAQEVQEIMPDAIKEFGEETKFLGLEKDAIYATLVNAIKELKTELDTLKNK